MLKIQFVKGQTETHQVTYQASINILTSVWSTPKSEQRVSIPAGLTNQNVKN